MRSQRPGSATAAAILAIIYGSLFTLCGLCGAASLVMQGGMGKNFMGGADPNQARIQKQLEDTLKRDIPGYQAFQVGGTIVGLGEALALLLAGIGLLNMQPWHACSPWLVPWLPWSRPPSRPRIKSHCHAGHEQRLSGHPAGGHGQTGGRFRWYRHPRGFERHADHDDRGRRRVRYLVRADYHLSHHYCDALAPARCRTHLPASPGTITRAAPASGKGATAKTRTRPGTNPGAGRAEGWRLPLRRGRETNSYDVALNSRSEA